MDIDRIEGKRFSVARRGYDREEVDAFLQALAAEHRQAIRAADEAARAASDAAASSGAHAFENVGSHVAAILATAAQAADDMKAGAEREADATIQAAAAEADKMRAAATKDLADAQRLRALTDDEVATLLAAARSDAAALLDDARRRAEEIDREAEAAAVRAERTAQANVEAVVAEGRREYERLIGLQRQCVDRLTSVELLVHQARDGLSTSANVDAAPDAGDAGLERLAPAPASAGNRPDDQVREVRALTAKPMRRRASSADRPRSS